MEKQQQILQMAKDICRVKHICNDVCNPISACDALRYAERAVEAGYVKQSEGEWKLGKSGLMYFCSSCGYAAHPREEEEWNFCPRCGAKMKGE